MVLYKDVHDGDVKIYYGGFKSPKEPPNIRYQTNFIKKLLIQINQKKDVNHNMENTNFIGNISTIVKYVSMLIAGWFIGLLVAHGFNLPIGAEELSQLISAIIFLALAHIDATNPNTIFNKTTETTSKKSNDECIEDINPASEYEIGEENGC